LGENYKQVAANLAAKVCEKLGLEVKHYKNYTKDIERYLESHALTDVIESYRKGDYEVDE
jgi:hypothetical protein